MVLCKGKGINLIYPHPQPCQYSVVLYNLTPIRELTQPWCESSPWGDLDQHAAYIPYRTSTSAVLPYVCWFSFYLHTEGWRAESTPNPMCMVFLHKFIVTKAGVLTMKLWKHLYAMHSVEQSTTTPYNLHDNSHCERFRCTLIDLLKSLSKEQKVIGHYIYHH